MDPKVKRIIKDIKSIKIQGARNIAKEVVKALIIQAKNSKAKTLKSLYSELVRVSEELKATRPTEPMLKNAIKNVINFTFMEMRKKGTVKELKEEIVEHSEKYLKQMEKNAENLWNYGSKIIQNKNVVITYCHSSTVTGILKKAHKAGKRFEVICFETRPRFQGRLTARELSKAGIKTTLAVDGATNMFMRKADLCIVGADAVTSTGNLVNKVGTSTLAHIARFHDVPFYCAAELYKFDPLTLHGRKVKIEERNYKEIWEKPPKRLKVRNPAFDITESRYISTYITEEGLISPQSFLSMVNKKLGKKSK